MPKIVNHKERRITIAQAAVEVIAEKGLESTKLLDIAGVAGITTGAITYYFSDKDAVLMAALEMSYDMMFANMDQVSAAADHTFYDIVAQALPITQESRTAMTVWVAFYSRSLVEPEVSCHQIATHCRWHSKIKQELVRHYQRIEMPVPEDINDVCEGITAQVNGIIVRSLTEEAGWPATRQRKLLKTYLTLIGI
jgi:TetR/AcrR family transcriptional repressor of bet genes